MMKLIVAGTRSFTDYSFLKAKLDNILSNVYEVEIVSGTANGADRLGELYALEKGCEVKRFPADWEAFGKKAGFIRNEQMAMYATHCVCFWDGVSRGTKSMIELAEKYNLQLRVIKY